jgi:hypothetical protein
VIEQETIRDGLADRDEDERDKLDNVFEDENNQLLSLLELCTIVS